MLRRYLPIVGMLCIGSWTVTLRADEAGNAFFEKQVRPLLVEHCYECHAGEERSGGLRLDSQPALLAGGDSGPALVPGDAEASRLIDAVRYTNRDLQMPPEGRLPQESIAMLERWVELGAPDTRLTPAADHPGGPKGMSLEEGRQHWSIRPLSPIPVPATAGDAWVGTPVDAFVLDRLHRAGLAPAPPADKRSLIRRLTFDLIGLPPSPEEINDFLQDDSPAAYHRLIDRLLGSPQYGVRWGRHWLDVARYADSNGLDENLAYGNAWRYRDYCIEAFNSNKPFDRFVVEQIAGDLLPEINPATLTATGFLALGAKVLAEPDRDKLVMDTIDEQLDTLGKAFLGLTLGCARCHDHKFDPISQRDYYALAAIFRGTQTFGSTNQGAIKHWYEHSFATPAELEQLKLADAEIAAKKSVAAKFKQEATAKLAAAAKVQAAEYLAAAALFEPDASLVDVAAIAAPRSLHPRILHHCRLHLEYNPGDPLFAFWHQQRAIAGTNLQSASESILQHYQELFEQAALAWHSAKERNASIKALEDQELERARQALEGASGFLVVPPQPEFAFDEPTLATYYQLLEEARLVESAAMDEPAAMGVRDGQPVTALPIHVRGSHRNLGEDVPREFPEVLQLSPFRPVFPRDESGRLQLAQWIASSQNPLTARVFVNRVWRWHFGQGLVQSTENFGALGDTPSHPELLDWLAREFMESGWSIKHLQRLILTSSVYQMASTHPQVQTCRELDPENRWLWQFRLQRLEVEQLRDAILAVANRLDMQIGGKSVPLRNRQFVFNHTSVDHTKYDSLRRAAYLPVIRNHLYPMFEQFDFPDPTMPSGNRQSTVVAPQALLLMNDEFIMDAAEALAERVIAAHSQLETRIDWAYQVTLARPASASELARAKDFVDDQLARGSSELLTWTLLCQALLASNEFCYVR